MPTIPQTNVGTPARRTADFVMPNSSAVAQPTSAKKRKSDDVANAKRFFEQQKERELHQQAQQHDHQQPQPKRQQQRQQQEKQEKLKRRENDILQAKLFYEQKLLEQQQHQQSKSSPLPHVKPLIRDQPYIFGSTEVSSSATVNVPVARPKKFKESVQRRNNHKSAQLSRRTPTIANHEEEDAIDEDVDMEDDDVQNEKRPAKRHRVAETSHDVNQEVVSSVRTSSPTTAHQSSFPSSANATRIPTIPKDCVVESSMMAQPAVLVSSRLDPRNEAASIGNQFAVNLQPVPQSTPPRSAESSSSQFRLNRDSKTFTDSNQGNRRSFQVEKPPFGSPMPDSTIRRRHQALLASQPKPFPQPELQNIDSLPPMPDSTNRRRHQHFLAFHPKPFRPPEMQGIDDLASSLRTSSEEKRFREQEERGDWNYENQRKHDKGDDDDDNLLEETEKDSSNVDSQIQDEDDEFETESKEVYVTAHRWEVRYAKRFFLCLLMLAIVLSFNLLLADTDYYSLLSSVGVIFNSNLTNNIPLLTTKRQSKGPPCFMDAIDISNIKTLSAQLDDPENNQEMDGIVLSFPPQCTNGIMEPCPPAAQCYKGILVECLHPIHLVVSENRDSCLLTEAGELYVKSIKDLLQLKIVKSRCSNYGNKGEHSFSVDVEMDDGTVRMTPSSSKSTTNMGIYFRYDDLANELNQTEDAILLQIANQPSTIFSLKRSDDNDNFVAFDPTVKVEIPVGCQVKLGLKRSVYAIVHTFWIIFSIAFRCLWGFFSDDPLFASIVATAAAIVGSIGYYFLRRRAAVRELVNGVVSLRQRVIAELSNQPGECVQVDLLCDRIVWSDYPDSRERRDRIRRELWPIVVKDINSDRRVLKKKKNTSYDSTKTYDHWQWIDNTTAK